MYRELGKEKIIVNIENLVKEAKDFDPDLSLYVRFMRDQILNVTTNN